MVVTQIWTLHVVLS